MSPENNKTEVVPGYPDGTTPDGRKGLICGFNKLIEGENGERGNGDCHFYVRVPVKFAKGSQAEKTADTKTRK
jgi:hypothetical protein